MWEDPEITPEMFQIYARNFPAKEASRNFISSVKILHSTINRNQRKSIYFQRRMYYNQECSTASSNTTNFLDQKPEEQETVCFSKVPHFNVHTIKMVYSSILNLIFTIMFHNKFILTAFEG